MENLEKLYQLLKADNIEIDTIELAESLWLSKYISKTESISSSDNTIPIVSKSEEQEHSNQGHISESSKDNIKVQQFTKQKRKDVPLHPISKGNNKNALPFRTPLVRSSYKDTKLIYAFRHFKQKIVSLKETTLDEEKIADYIAQTNILDLFIKRIMKKDLEYYLSLIVLRV